jgi:rsbT co-antagonist protein RsbR
MADIEERAVQIKSDQARMAGLLRDNGEVLLDRWLNVVSVPLRGRIGEAELRREFKEIYTLLLQTLESADPTASGELRAVLTELSRARARQGFSPTETAVSVFALKDAVYEFVSDRPELVPDFLAFSSTVDNLGLHTFESFVTAREQVITDQAEQLLELSTPVVKLWEGIVAVPLVGTLDSARTQVVMEKLLQTLVDTGAEHAVIDITGVPAVDTEVAQHLLKTVMAARLMGAECTISGIRPQIAHTIVTLGIEFGDVATKATLADALAHALRSGGLEVVRRAGA